MEFSDAVRKRRMVRSYRDEPIDPVALERILERARRAPSAGFAQGQSFVVVTDPDRRREIARLAGEKDYVARDFDPWLSQAPVHVVLCVDEGAYEERYSSPDKVATGGRSWPVPYGFVDCGASLMLLLLAAVDEGLSAGFFGVHRLDGIRALLHIPGTVIPVGLVTIGHAAPDRSSSSLRRGWKPLDQVVHRERWQMP